MSRTRWAGTSAPSARASATVFSSPSASRSVRYNSAPSAARFRAVALPIPLAGPVGKQRLPEKPLPRKTPAMAVTIPSPLLVTPECAQPQLLNDLHRTRGILTAADKRAVMRQRHACHGCQRPRQCRQVVGDRLRVGILLEESDQLVDHAVVEVIHDLADLRIGVARDRACCQ